MVASVHRSVLCLVLVLTGCAAAPPTPGTLLDERLQTLAALVHEWESAPSVAAAHTAAEATANAVVGPDGPGYGDRDGDGNVRGAVEAGLLPGARGERNGIVVDALDDGAPNCLRHDALGGSWEDPDARWEELHETVAASATGRAGMSRLPSRLQRIVGWAELSLQSGDEEAVEEHAVAASTEVAAVQQALHDCAAVE